MGGRGKRRVPAQRGQRQLPAQCGQRQAPDPDIEGCKPDSIYFVRNGEGSFGTRAWRYDHGVYDVYMGTISQFPISNSTLMKKTRQPPIWVLPTFQL